MPVRKDKSGYWHVEVCHQRQRVHKRLPKGATAGDAKRLEAEVRLSLGQVSADPEMTALLSWYTEHYCPRLASPDTARYHAYRAAPWCEGKRASQARQIASEMTQDMHGKYAAGTINKSLNAVSRALRIGWERGLTQHDHSREITRIPENNARERVLTLDEVQRLSDSASEQVRVGIWIGLYTGMRRREILTLDQSHIGDVLTIPAANAKTRKMRTVPIVPQARPWLERVPLKITMEGFKTSFARARVKAGLPDVQFRDLRRSCGTMLIRAGVDLYVVSKILGHSSTGVTQKHYAHLLVDQLKDGMNKAFV
jgi:integrase